MVEHTIVCFNFNKCQTVNGYFLSLRTTETLMMNFLCLLFVFLNLGKLKKSKPYMHIINSDNGDKITHIRTIVSITTVDITSALFTGRFLLYDKDTTSPFSV